MWTLFKAKCPWCDTPLPKKPTIVIVESADGKYEVEVCEDCGDTYEYLAKDDEDDEPV